jgi:LruC domain-containing protein
MKTSCKLLLIITCIISVIGSARAEGTKEMSPTSSVNNVELQINRSSQGGFASTFAGWTATSVNDRLFIHIRDFSTEKIYVGFKKVTSSQSVFYRIKRPDGTVIAGPTAIPNSGNGFINSWSEANIGPRTLTGNTNGYQPLVIDLNASAASRFNGDYYIEFNTSSSSANTDEIFLEYYDITVASGASNTSVQMGRLWSYNWGFNSKGFTPPDVCVGSLYVYSRDSVVTQIDLNGISPYYFRIFANSTGVGNTGNIVQDRKSKNFGSTNPNERPEFKIFLNDPDNISYPSAVGGNRSATFNSFSGCPGNYCFNFTINGEALAELRLDLNNNGVYTDPVDRVLEVNVVAGQNCIPWNGLNGLGATVTTNTNIKLELSTKVGTLHIPVYDAEQHTNGYLASIVRPLGIGAMTVYWDDDGLSGGSTNLTGTPAGTPVSGGATASGQHSWMDPAGNQRTMNTWFTTKKTVVSNYTIPVVSAGPPVVSPLSGADSFCESTTTNLSAPTPGGVWSSNNTAVATVNSSGVVTAVSAGSVIISYAVTTSCGTTTVTKNLTVNRTPTVGPITGDSIVFANRTITLSDTTLNGTWASNNITIATVNASGLVRGVAPGTTTITYSVINSCSTVTTSKIITVSNLPPAAVNDTVSTPTNIPKNINPLTNDVIGSYPFVPTSIEFLTGTAPDPSTTGTFVINSNGTVTFTSVTNYTGIATIGYRIYDSVNQFTTAYIVVNVSGPCSLDVDNDGVPDCLDDYPTDSDRAFDNYFPSDDFATLMYEDLWPNAGDYDLNDVVINYQANTITNGLNQVVEMHYTIVARCTGAGLHNGFAFQLDNVPSNKITSVSGTKASGANWLSIGSNGLENGQSFANVIVYNDLHKVLQNPGSGSFVNTEMSAPKVPYDTSHIVITFLNEGVAPSGGTISLTDLPHTAFNPYLILGDSGTSNQIRSKELHLIDRVPSSKMDNTWFGTKDDSSNPGQGRYYKTANNLPWALQISSSIPYMQEKQDISSGYLKFLEWATSNGTSNTNWYLDLTGHRENNKIYTK